jgi:hypothetical protein
MKCNEIWEFQINDRHINLIQVLKLIKNKQ